MALSLESQGRVRQKTREITKQPGIFYALKSLFLYLSIYKKNSDLQLVVLDPALIAAGTGQVAADVAATVYAVWGRKPATATDAFVQLHDSATTDQTAANNRLAVPFLTASDEQLFISPNGVPFASGVTVGSMTTTAGVTHNAAADAPTGFVILGA